MQKKLIPQEILSNVQKLKSILVGGVLFLLGSSLLLPIKVDNLEPSANKNEARWYEQLEKIEHNAQNDIDVIFLGSSSMYNAIDEELVEKITGRKSLNLALFGDFGVYGDYQLLKRWLRTSASIPKAVVIWHSFDVWSRPLEQREIILTSDDVKEISIFYWKRANAAPFSRSSLHFPVVWAATALKALLQNNIFLFRNNNAYQKKITSYFGFLGVYSEPINRTKNITNDLFANYWQQQRQVLIDYAFNPSYANTYWFTKLLELVGENKIELLVSRAPLNERVLNDTDMVKSINRYNLELTKYLLSFGEHKVQILNEQQIIFREEMGRDINHVNRIGRQHVTNQISHQLLKRENLSN